MLTSDFRDALQARHGQQHNDALVSANPKRTLADEETGDTDVFVTCGDKKEDEGRLYSSIFTNNPSPLGSSWGRYSRAP